MDAAEQNRTVDTRIFSPLLYRLSYSGDHVDIYIIRLKKCQSAFKNIFKKHNPLRIKNS